MSPGYWALSDGHGVLTRRYANGSTLAGHGRGVAWARCEKWSQVESAKPGRLLKDRARGRAGAGACGRES